MKTCQTLKLRQGTEFPLNIDPSFSQQASGRIQKLLTEDLSFVVKRLIIQEKLPEDYANRLKTEFLRFVALRQQYSGIIVPSKAIDVFWHAFILYTEEYTAFCERHLGGYMHHRPQDHFASTASISIAAKRTMEHLDQMFQNYDSEMWKQHAICCDPGDCGCP